MERIDKTIDDGKAFDFGRVSEDYAKFRDIYPKVFYEKIVNQNLCVKGQKVLDLGTGTGVLPRNMYRFGAEWYGTDISENQIKYAKILSEKQGMNIRYQTVAAEDVDFANDTFDVITACQCFWYFDHEKIMPKLHRILKRDGQLLLLYMAWLPFEDEIAKASEALILKYNPKWTGANEMKHPIQVPDLVYQYMKPVSHEEYDIDLTFTIETWHGRMKACRGVGASLTPEEIKSWEREHLKLLQRTAPKEFTVKHYAAMLRLGKI